MSSFPSEVLWSWGGEQEVVGGEEWVRVGVDRRQEGGFQRVDGGRRMC